MPVWNRAGELEAAIASVQGQTLDNWELLIVDDGSTDATPDVVRSVAANDPRIKLLQQPHLGVSRARNLAVEHARGRYVSFLDSDNVFVPHFLRSAVAAMSAQGWRAAYSAMKLRQSSGTTFRALEASRELLEVRNQIDLNVLVLERVLLDQVGQFDERLRRAVDYDLILRIGTHEPIRYLPFIGVVYDHAEDDLDRITNRELDSWLEVSQNNHLIDWSSCQARVRGRVSVLVPTYQDWKLTYDCVDAVLADAHGDDVEIVVIDNASRRSVGAILTAMALTDDRLTVAREPVNRNFALGSNLAFARSSGEIVVFLNNDTEVQPGWLAPLKKNLRENGILAAQPLLLYPDGTVQSAGLVFPARGTLPVHFLAHHPAEDLKRIGTSFEVSAITGVALAIRAEDFAALRGFDPIFRNGWEDVDLCLRLAQRRPGQFTVVADSVVLHHEAKTPGRHKHADDNWAVFRERWADGLPAPGDKLWEAAGFTVTRYRPEKITPRIASRIAVPILTRRVTTVPAGPGKGLPALRWAIKSAASARDTALYMGDTYFAGCLGAALRQLGQEVVIDSEGAHDRESAYLDDVVLTLRGGVQVPPQPGVVNLLWVISHPDEVDDGELRSYDAVFAAGAPWAERMTQRVGRSIAFLPLCTDPDRFHPDAAEPDTGESVLFVGDSWTTVQPVVREALAEGAELAIHSRTWERLVDNRHVRATLVPDEKVATFYRSAGLVLDEHRKDLRCEGFVSHRVFDATASGARVISDDVAGLHELFGEAVRTYRTVEELKALLSYPKSEFPLEPERLRLAELVRREHSFAARARQLLKAAVELWDR
jgi:glycosyltransferase involved in cell wall biosynthesis